MNDDHPKVFLQTPESIGHRIKTYFIVTLIVVCGAVGSYFAYTYFSALGKNVQNSAELPSDTGDSPVATSVVDSDIAPASPDANASQIQVPPGEYPEASSMPVKPPRPPPEADYAAGIEREAPGDTRPVRDAAAANELKKLQAQLATLNREITTPKTPSKESVRKESAKSALVKGTAANFRTEVERSQGVVLVDFWAPWCGPCRQMSPLVDQVRSEAKVKVVKVNVDDAPTLSTRFQIHSIPCLMIFKDGKLVDQRVGTQAKDALNDWVKRYTH